MQTKWRCALIQRWLPGYLGDDLSPARRRRMTRHLEACPACRQELAGLEAVVQAVAAQPVPDPGPRFWHEFDRELHLKLVQAGQTPAAEPRSFWRFRLPYALVGAPALAVLLLWLAIQWWPAAPKSVAAGTPPDALVYAALEEGLWQEPEEPGWEVEAVLVDLTPREREAVLKRVSH